MQDDDKPEQREAASDEAGPRKIEVRDDDAADEGTPPSPEAGAAAAAAVAGELEAEEAAEAAGGESEEGAAEDGEAAGDAGDEAAASADAEEAVEESVSAEEVADVELAAIEFLESQMEATKAELDAVKLQLSSAQEEVKTAQGARARLQADFDNFRKRQERELQRLQEEKAEKILLKILPVYDTFGRAIDQYEKDNSEDALYDGLQRIEKMFLQLLEGAGVTPIEAAGKPFDPNIHDAVCRVPIPEDGFDEMVVDVFEGGYLVGEKVLKPAKVSVAKED